jgi:hypothetical protein
MSGAAFTAPAIASAAAGFVLPDEIFDGCDSTRLASRRFESASLSGFCTGPDVVGRAGAAKLLTALADLS